MKTVIITALIVCFAVCFLCVSGCKKPMEPEKKNGDKEKAATEVQKPGTVVFQSLPLGVEVYIDGELKGRTPLTLQLEDGKKYSVEFKDEEHGYETETREIDNKAGLVSVSLRKKRE